MKKKEHYLEKELIQLIKNNDRVFEFIQNGPMDGIWFWDLENPDNQWMNDKFWLELGYEPDEMDHSPKSWQNIANRKDLEISQEKVAKHIKDPNFPFEQIMRFTHKDGYAVYMNCRGSAIRDTNGKAIRMIGTHTNITPAVKYGLEKDLNKQLLSLNKELESKNKELRQFTYITSHDLQEPLNSILSFSRLLETNRDNLNEIGQKSLDVIVYSANRMKDFITALLFYSRIGKEKEKSLIDFNHVITNLKIDLHEMMERDGAQIKYIGEITKINVYENDFYQLILNLTTNAFKYVDTNVSPVLVIDSKETSDKITFSFADNGIGIEEQYFEKIFEVFQRLHAEDKYQGTGIGLAHCKRVVELHGGQIWLTSKPGEGSTFYFTIEK